MHYLFQKLAAQPPSPARLSGLSPKEQPLDLIEPISLIGQAITYLIISTHNLAN